MARNHIRQQEMKSPNAFPPRVSVAMAVAVVVFFVVRNVPVYPFALLSP
jgi:hypothetical protein